MNTVPSSNKVYLWNGELLFGANRVYYDLMASTEIYQFEPVRNRDGEVSPYHHRFADAADFQIHPQLLQQIDWDKCRETTPEGKALWLYIRLCQVLKYDEGFFYSEYRHNPNDDPYKSFQIVSQVTAETPVTCFNFSRIAVKLLNQIPGVHALMIAVGNNYGHFRFGYYTDKVSVDAEATSPLNHYNDMARVKLGIEPQGLKVFDGQICMQELMQKVAQPMLALSQRKLPEYLQILEQVPTVVNTQIDIRHLVAEFKDQGLDGASVAQVVLQMNHQLQQAPYKLARAGLYDETHTIIPQLLIRQNDGQNVINQINLTNLDVERLSGTMYRDLIDHGVLVYPVGFENADAYRWNFERGLPR